MLVRGEGVLGDRSTESSIPNRMCPLPPLSFHVPHQPTQTIPSGTHEQVEAALLLMCAWVGGSSPALPLLEKEGLATHGEGC